MTDTMNGKITRDTLMNTEERDITLSIATDRILRTVTHALEVTMLSFRGSSLQA